MHVTVWVVAKVASTDWFGVLFKIRTNFFLRCGAASALAMTLLLLLSLSVVCYAFYKTFLNTYISFVVVAFVGT